MCEPNTMESKKTTTKKQKNNNNNNNNKKSLHTSSLVNFEKFRGGQNKGLHKLFLKVIKNKEPLLLGLAISV